jgi:sugar lactone lactonase YvrE
MRVVKQYILGLLGLLVISAIALALVLSNRYGGGQPYPDLSTAPVLDKAALEPVLSYPEPIGNLAVAADGRVFFTVHPESRPEGNKLLVFEHGQIHPFPAPEMQKALFDTVLGVRIDGQGRLWTIDHGDHASGQARLLAFDLASGKPVFDLKFSREVAPLGSFLQDMVIAPDGRFVYIADVSFWRKQPGIVVVDTQANQPNQPSRAWRALDAHPSVSNQDWLIRNPIKDMVFLGLVTLKPGIDGITLSRDGKMLYYGAMAHDTLFRIPVAALATPELAQTAGAAVQAVGKKPLNDGLSSDDQGNIYLTDVEHGSVMRHGSDGKLITLIRDDARIRWADALSFGPDGYLYLADSAIPDQMLRSKAHMAARAPYYIYRFKSGATAAAGQ